MIKRLLQDKLIKSLKLFPAIGITGPRQVGKTTLAKQLMKSGTKPMLYLDLEKESDRHKLDDAEIFLQAYKDKTLILDEVQNMPALFPLMRSLIDEKRTNGRFILLGSISPDLIVKYSSESLAGRVQFNELTPLNFTEVKKYGIKKHWLLGGFPLSLLKSKTKDAIEWQDSFISSYIERDLSILGLITERLLMRRLWRMLGILNSSIIDYSSLGRSLSVSYNTVIRYLSFLEDAYIVNLLFPYHINLKKRLVKSPKIYIRDSGILHRLLNINSFNELINHPAIGASWEGYVIEQIRQVTLGKYYPYYYRTHAGAEIDLVLEKAGKPNISIEIKFSKSPSLTKGNINAIEDLKTENNFVIGFNVDTYKIKNNIQVCSLDTFLTKFLPELSVVK